MKLQRIVVIVNKKWEAAAVLNVFRAPYTALSRISAKPFEWPVGKSYPLPNYWPDSRGTHNFEYRYVLQFGDIRVECWCLADFEDTSDSGQEGQVYSGNTLGEERRPGNRNRYGCVPAVYPGFSSRGMSRIYA